jgi:hypothetical protein
MLQEFGLEIFHIAKKLHVEHLMRHNMGEFSVQTEIDITHIVDTIVTMDMNSLENR